MKEKSYLPGTHPDLPPPSSEVGVIGWARKNLFATPADTIFTLLALYVLFSIVPSFIQWAFIDAGYVAENREACWKMMETPGGAACWAFTSIRLNQLLYGFYPETEIWRINLSFVLLFVALAPVLIDRLPFRKQLFIFTGLYPFLAGWLIFGWFAL
ncbi:MAG: amino acid ABC transporter permease, partial [Pseudomonadota bacterium]|nr:amino acid ABC transporter permease [Pseudomonadota bacterium]